MGWASVPAWALGSVWAGVSVTVLSVWVVSVAAAWSAAGASVAAGAADKASPVACPSVLAAAAGSVAGASAATAVSSMDTAAVPSSAKAEYGTALTDKAPAIIKAKSCFFFIASPPRKEQHLKILTLGQV